MMVIGMKSRNKLSWKYIRKRIEVAERNCHLNYYNNM